MPPAFTAMLADHIGKLGPISCHEAREGEVLRPGQIHLAPGGYHLTVHSAASSLSQASVGSARGPLVVRLNTDPPENFCRPAVDPMLRSASGACEGRVLVVMLTGMGHDGLAGTRTVIEAGGAAIAQDEETSVVWGMPGAIAQAGLCHAVLPLPAIAGRVRELLRDPRA
jgi:two-component system chemotaxis response regulator CheB